MSHCRAYMIFIVHIFVLFTHWISRLCFQSTGISLIKTYGRKPLRLMKIHNSTFCLFDNLGSFISDQMVFACQSLY